MAPTVVEPDDGGPWREHTLVVGRALGRPERAEQLVAEIGKRFADAIEQHPELEGKTVAVRFGDSDLGSYYLLEPIDPRTGLFTSLGLELPEKTGEVSREQVEVLDQDVIVVVGAEPAAYQGDELFQGLRAVKEGRVFAFGDAAFAGSAGELRLKAPVVGVAPRAQPSMPTRRRSLGLGRRSPPDWPPPRSGSFHPCSTRGRSRRSCTD
ncbi:MAG: ABC transporter substrate-binding protein [Actinomycetota bacterium]|nr:ABC transporter substrate-binding protein [Actinomycetota bacterium]